MPSPGTRVILVPRLTPRERHSLPCARAQADTPGCTTQACLYRDSVNEGAFAAVGYTVVGLSRDKPMAQNKWKTKHTLGYTLLSDPEGELLGQLGQTADKKCVPCSQRASSSHGALALTSRLDLCARAQAMPLGH